MQDRSFEETKQLASDTLNDMNHEVAVLTRTYNNYIKHGAVNAAAELQEIIASKTQDIEAEEWVFSMAFN